MLLVTDFNIMFWYFMDQYLIIEDRNDATFIMLGIIVNKKGTEWDFCYHIVSEKQ